MAQSQFRGELNGLALLASGAILVGATLGGFVVGMYSDRAFHTFPVGAVIGLLVGFLIGIVDIYRVAMRIMQSQPAPPPLPEENEEETRKSAADEE